MATDDQRAVALRGGGQEKMGKAIALTMAAGATTADTSFAPPAGSRVSAIRSYTAAAFSGGPTNINLTVGKTAGGTDYVAAVDIKGANASTSLTLVAAPDWASWPAGQAVCAQIAAVGGASPAGTVIVEVDYSPPNP
jgi:hypothetical protein